MKSLENKEVNQIVEQILADYEMGKDIDTLKVYDQPDRMAIKEIVNKLIHIVYPGYYRDKVYKSYNLRGNLTVLIEDVLYKLSKQIAIVLKYDCNTEPDEKKIEDDAYEITLKFFSKIPMIREYVQTDLEATFEGDPAACNKDEIILSYPGLLATTINRLAHEL